MFNIWIIVEIISWIIVIGLISYLYSDKRLAKQDRERGMNK